MQETRKMTNEQEMEERCCCSQGIEWECEFLVDDVYKDDPNSILDGRFHIVCQRGEDIGLYRDEKGEEVVASDACRFNRMVMCG